MPYVYVYQCDRCGADMELTLSREFRRTESGERADYDYPAADRYEWPPKRVAGLWSHLWCPGCRGVRPHIVTELEVPAEHPVQAFLSAEGKGLTGAESGPCPECGAGLQIEVEGAACPACEEGRLVCIGEYEP